MNIHGLVVSVDYADLLARSIDRWMEGLASLTIVTDLHDHETATLAMEKNANLCRTDVFSRHGAKFNKGAAQNEAWFLVDKTDWILLFDADIVPPADWKTQLEVANLRRGFLYGCYRYDDNGMRLRDDTHGYGFFQLFHSSDPEAQVHPFFDGSWIHAGNGDSIILLRWRVQGKLAPALPLRLHHPGVGPSHNWFGRDKLAEFQAMERERRRKGGGWASLEGERVQR